MSKTGRSHLGAFAVLLTVTLAVLVGAPPPAAAATCGASFGDLNGDSAKTVSDAQCAILTTLWTLTGDGASAPGCLESEAAANLNCDGSINITDVQIVIWVVLGVELSATVDTNGNQCPDNCEASAALTPSQPGDLVITELMPDPVAVDDEMGEYIELHNPTSTDFDLNGLELADLWSDSHVISASIIVPAGGYAVLGRHADPALNGGVAVDYAYGPDVTLSNDSDELLLLHGGTILDEVAYDDSWPFGPGVAMGVAPGSLADDNAVASAWCDAPFGLGIADFGSPGAPTPGCPVCGDGAVEGLETCEGKAYCDATCQFATPFFDTNVQPLIGAKCGSCHGDTPGFCQGAACLATDYGTYAQAPLSGLCAGLSMAECLLLRVESGTMPPTGACTGDGAADAATPACFDAVDQDFLELWVALGAPGTDPGDEGGTDTIGPELCEGTHPAPARARLLTRAELDNTLTDLLGVSTDAAKALLPPENLALGFENNAESNQASPLWVEQALAVAELVSAAVVADAASLGQVAPCAVPWLSGGPPSESELAACRDAFIPLFGQRAFRRPLTTEELTEFRAIFDAGASAEGPVQGVAWVVQVAIQSPQLLYRYASVAPGETVGSAVALDAYEIAARLSYFLWASMPDDALLEAAATGKLTTIEGVEDEAWRLIDHPRAQAAIDSFHRQWWHLDDLEQIEKDLPEDSPVTSTALGESWKDSVLAFAYHVLYEQGGTVYDLMTSPLVFVDETLAAIYPEAAGITGGLAPVVFPGNERAGLITQPGILAMLAHPNQSSPIRRGIFVRENLMCEPLQPPPADLLIEIPDPDPTATTKEIFAEHTANAQCQGCHILIDPIGFGIEGYDEFGLFREFDNGKPVDVVGEVTFPYFDDELAGPFEGAVELGAKLATSPQIDLCMTMQWYRFAMGRGDSSDVDQCNLAEVFATFQEAGGGLRELLVAIAVSDAFLLREGAEWAEPPAIVEEPDPDPGDPEPVDVGDYGDEECEGDLGASPPIGFFDAVSPSGVAHGWALDPNVPSYHLFIDVYVDGVRIEPMARADQPRPDVNSVTGYCGDHGFKFLLPAQARDGNPHTIQLYAIDTGDSGNLHLSNSPKTFQLGNGISTPPTGFVDVVTNSGYVAGWSYDADDPVTPVAIDFYLDAPSYLGGTAIGSTTTGLPRPDVNAAFGLPAAVQSGYNYQLPPEVMDGLPHVLYAESNDLAVSGLVGFLNPGNGKAFVAGEATP